jgi:hypothetical protein
MYLTDLNKKSIYKSRKASFSTLTLLRANKKGIHKRDNQNKEQVVLGDEIF